MLARALELAAAEAQRKAGAVDNGGQSDDSCQLLASRGSASLPHTGHAERY